MHQRALGLVLMRRTPGVGPGGWVKKFNSIQAGPNTYCLISAALTTGTTIALAEIKASTDNVDKEEPKNPQVWTLSKKSKELEERIEILPMRES